MIESHPEQAYTFLRWLKKPTYSGAHLKQLKQYLDHRTRRVKLSPSEEVEPPDEPFPNYDLWLTYCVDKGLVRELPHFAPEVTQAGELALLLHEQASATTTEPNTTTPTPDPPAYDPATTILYEGGETYSGGGGKARPVAGDCYHVLQAFLARKRVMSTNELEAEGVKNVSRAMKKLKELFPSAVELPGTGEGVQKTGYLVRVTAKVHNE